MSERESEGGEETQTERDKLVRVLIQITAQNRERQLMWTDNI